MNIQHQVFASVECKSCITQFHILTRSFGGDAGKIILTYKSIPISQFIQLNLQFEKKIIKAVYAGHVNTPNDPVIRDLVYLGKVGNVFSPSQIDKAIQLGELYSVDKIPTNDYTLHSVGVDFGFGSSNTAIVSTEFLKEQGLIRVIYAHAWRSSGDR